MISGVQEAFSIGLFPGARVQIRGEKWLTRDARQLQQNVFALRVAVCPKR